MGRAAAFLADCLALARLLVDAAGIWASCRNARLPAGEDRPPDGRRPDVAEPPAVDPRTAGAGGESGDRPGQAPVPRHPELRG